MINDEIKKQKEMKMLKFEIYEPKEEKRDEIIRLRLISGMDGVKVCAVDRNGNREASGSLVLFRKDGMIRLLSDISKFLGFDLDGDGRIKVQR